MRLRAAATYSPVSADTPMPSAFLCLPIVFPLSASAWKNMLSPICLKMRWALRSPSRHFCLSIASLLLSLPGCGVWNPAAWVMKNLYSRPRTCASPHPRVFSRKSTSVSSSRRGHAPFCFRPSAGAGPNASSRWVSQKAASSISPTNCARMNTRNLVAWSWRSPAWKWPTEPARLDALCHQLNEDANRRKIHACAPSHESGSPLRVVFAFRVRELTGPIQSARSALIISTWVPHPFVKQRVGSFGGYKHQESLIILSGAPVGAQKEEGQCSKFQLLTLLILF